MKYLTLGPSGVLSISYHDLCFTKLEISWQVLIGTYVKKKSGIALEHWDRQSPVFRRCPSWLSVKLFLISTLGKRHFVCFCGSNSRWKYAVPTLPSKHRAKVINPKYSKHWLSTVAHIIDCVCSKILNHGLNHGLLLSLFKFFGWKNMLN